MARWESPPRERVARIDVRWALDVTILTNPLTFLWHFAIWFGGGLVVAQLLGLIR